MGYRPSLVKSVQTGTVAMAPAAITNTATLATTVDATNSVLVYLGGVSTLASFDESSYLGRITLTNGTTVTANRLAGSGTLTIRFSVVEYYPRVLKSVQYGTVTLAGAASGTAAITSVNTAKSHVAPLGYTNSGVAGLIGTDGFPDVTLTSNILVTATRGGNTNNVVLSFVVVEFN